MNNSNTTLAAFVIGAVAGGATALLFAPMSGERLRERIAERGGELKENTSKTARAAAELARETVDGARSAAKQKAAAVSGAVEVGRAAYREELEKAKSA
jgi:gas vesicle protein